MLLTSPSYPLAYESIVGRSRGTASSTTFLLVSPDPDALCAARLLHSLLAGDSVPNTLLPVASFSELEEVELRLRGEEVRSLILINLGAVVDLYTYFGYLDPRAVVHVIDSHRPVSLPNLFTTAPWSEAAFDQRRKKGAKVDEGLQRGMEVVFWIDPEGEEGRDEQREAFKAIEFEPEPDSDDSDTDSESDEELGGGRNGRDGSESREGSEDEDGEPTKRRRTAKEPAQMTKAQARRYRARIERYYSTGQFYGQSVASQVFLLAIQLERADADAVWLAILGLTYQFTTGLIDKDRYERHVALLEDEVIRLAPAPTGTNGNGADPGPNDRSIRAVEEMRFCLYRHWNLYDSMYHSSYLASKMRLWTERGRRNLSGMLAKMGCPLSESSEHYAHMASDLKASLIPSVTELAPEYGLDELLFPSFLRRSGYRSELSASDAVEGLGALLEVASGVRLDFNAASGAAAVGMAGQGKSNNKIQMMGSGREEWASRFGGARAREKQDEVPEGEEETDDEKAERRAKRDKDDRERNFWLAWDALNPNTVLLRAALPLSMALHRSLSAQGQYILEKPSMIRTLRTFRLCLLRDGPELAVFRHPATLVRLANWLVDAVRDLMQTAAGTAALVPGRKSKPLPFVLAVLNEAADAFLVVGVVGAPEFGDVKKNLFGLAFAAAAASSGARSQQNTFEASVVEVRKDDIDRFLQTLALPLPTR